MKRQLSSKTQFRGTEAQFKTPVIRLLTELFEFGCKLDKKMKAMLQETKKNRQGTNSEGKETRTQINTWRRRKKETFNQKRIKKQEFRKMREGLGTSRTSFNIPTSKS